MRPVASSIRVNPPVGDPDGSEADGQAAGARRIEVDRGDDLARVRIDADDLRQPVGPCIDADPDLLAVARHRAVQRHAQADLVGGGIDPHHLTRVLDAHPDTTGSSRHDLRPVRSRSDRPGSSRRRGWSRDRCAGPTHCARWPPTPTPRSRRRLSGADATGISLDHLAGDRVDPQEGVVLVVRLPDGTGAGRRRSRSPSSSGGPVP